MSTLLLAEAFELGSTSAAKTSSSGIANPFREVADPLSFFPFSCSECVQSSSLLPCSVAQTWSVVLPPFSL